MTTRLTAWPSDSARHPDAKRVTVDERAGAPTLFDSRPGPSDRIDSPVLAARRDRGLSEASNDDSPETYCSSGTSPTEAALRVHLVGLGKVGLAFLERAADAGLRIVGATDSTATILDRAGLDPLALAAHKRAGGSLRDLPGALQDDVARSFGLIAVDVVADAAATDPNHSDDALLRGQAALDSGASLALASKDGVAAAGSHWLSGAQQGRVGINAVLGGTGAGLVAELDRLRRSSAVALAGNATTTTVIEAVEKGASIAEGIALAGERGLLESDPELDLRGTDAAVKLAIVASAVSGERVPVDSIPAVDVRDLDPELLRRRALRGATTRLVGRFDAAEGPRLAFEEFPRFTPLAVPCDRVAYTYRLSCGSVRVLRGRGLGPGPTADALLADVLALPRLRRTGGEA